jgi:hypothetical protein
MARKIGEGHFSGWLRMGLHEVRNAFYTNSNIAQKQPEMGIFGQLTLGEVAEGRRGPAEGLEQEAAQDHGLTLDDRLQQAERRDEPERDDREMER